MAKSKLFLIDGHALCYRSFYAIRGLTTSKGQPTNAVYGFIRNVRSILQAHRPEYMAVCFDSKEKTKRQEKFAEYKIQRPAMPDDLITQIPLIKEAIEAFNLAVFEKAGYEADDLIATLAKKASQKGVEVVIVSDDKDLYQLASSDIKYLSSKSDEILNTRLLKEKLGFDPKKIVDFIGLAGDSSDNIPGVKGIGAVNARQLINDIGCLESIIKRYEKIKAPKGKEKLIIDQRESALFSKELAILDSSVPVDVKMSELKVREPDRDSLFEIFRGLEFKQLTDEFAPDNAPGNVEVTDLGASKGLKQLVVGAEKTKRLTFYIEGFENSGLFQAGTAFLTVEGGPVFSCPVSNLTALKTVFENESITKVTYDIKSVMMALEQCSVSIEGEAFDVMLAGYLLGAAQASFELNELVWTRMKRSLPAENSGAQKAMAISELHPILAQEMKDKSLTGLFKDIEMPLAKVLYTVEKNGVRLDLALLKRLSRDCAKKIDALTKALFEMAGEEFNINSPKQLSKILFEKLNLPVIKKTKTGFSTNEAVLTLLAQEHEFPSLILEYRQLAKLKSTYIDALPKLVDPDTGKVHAQFNQTGTETGRLSSSRPNLQNIPVRTELGKQIRKAIIPSNDDHLLIAADYSQIELRILAHLSQDKGLLKAFKKNEDIHRYTASLIFDTDEKSVTAEMRNSAKRVNFGIIYGISTFGLANDLKVTHPEAQEFIDRYFARYPAVKKFMDNEIKKCEQKGYVLTILNRRRYIPEIKSSNPNLRQFAQRQAINTPVQGSAADLIKLAMLNIQKAIEKEKWSSKMISTVHDELVFEAPVTEKKRLADMVRKNMEHAVELDVPIKVSVKAGKNWLEMSEVRP